MPAKRTKPPAKPRAREKPDGTVGAPRAAVDLAHVRELASGGATLKEIATKVGVSDRTLSRRPDCGDAIKRGEDDRNVSLKQTVVRLALGQIDRATLGNPNGPTYIRQPNVTMLIWATKNFLGWRDAPDEGRTRELPPLTVEGEAVDSQGN